MVSKEFFAQQFGLRGGLRWKESVYLIDEKNTRFCVYLP